MKTALSGDAVASLHPLPGEIGNVVEALVTGDIPREIGGVSGEEISQAHKYLKDTNVYVVVSRSSMAQSEVPIIEALTSFQELDNCRFLPLVRRANTMGALDMGMAPGLLPGRNTLSSGSRFFSDIWTNLPTETGANTKQIIQKASDGEIDILFPSRS